MLEIKYTNAFKQWLESITEVVTRVRLKKRLDKASRGILGDVEPVGESVFEMREHFGAGYRMYYVKRGKRLIVMLGGGDKPSQRKDIEKAKQLAKQLED